MEHYFGAHTVDNGGIHMAARRAAGAGMRALQIFTAIPKYYNDKVSIRGERVERFRETLAATAIAPERVVVHAAYVLNTATPDADKWTRARDGLPRSWSDPPHWASAQCASILVPQPTRTGRPRRSESLRRSCTRWSR